MLWFIICRCLSLRSMRFGHFLFCLVRLSFVGGKVSEKMKRQDLVWRIFVILRRKNKNKMASTAEITPSSTYTPVQILALKDTLKTAIDKENNIDLLRKCALLLSTDKDMYDLSRAVSMGSLLSMVKEDIHTMFQNTAQ